MVLSPRRASNLWNPSLACKAKEKAAALKLAAEKKAAERARRDGRAT